jgi:hypothetical protein
MALRPPHQGKYSLTTHDSGVLVLFMTDAPTAATPVAPSDPHPPGADKESRVGRLVALVRKLIDYGRELAATLHGRDPATHARYFGTSDIALILARITQGLHRARALEERLVRNAARLDAAPRPRTAPAPRKPRTAQPSNTAPAALVPRLDPGICLPTPEQIAALVRSRPIGAVIADICRDLGILPNHPLWREVQVVIIKEGGNFAVLVRDIITQATRSISGRWSASLPTILPAPVLPSPSHAGADPP